MSQRRSAWPRGHILMALALKVYALVLPLALALRF